MTAISGLPLPQPRAALVLVKPEPVAPDPLAADPVPPAPLAPAPATPALLAAEPVLKVPEGVRLLPAESVLLLAVSLPAMTAAQRRSAVAFAVEDRIAQPLDEVEVALGPRLASGDWLVAVTARSVLETASPGPALWPDVLLLPVPVTGWAVWTAAGRSLVRLADGTGLATATAGLTDFWVAAGSPVITLYGGTLPSGMPATRRADLPSAPAPVGFDVHGSGTRLRGRLALPSGLRAVLAVVGLAALAHLVLLGLDTWALDRLADRREADLRLALNIPADADLDLALTQALAARQPADAQGGALALLARVFATIAAQSGRVSVQTLRYAAADQAAVLTVEAPDLATLQAVETALTTAGLAVTAGAATSRDGAAEVQMTVSDGGGS